eukprot:8113222-Pyramimonas_sp.AAC.1
MYTYIRTYIHTYIHIHIFVAPATGVPRSSGRRRRYLKTLFPVKTRPCEDAIPCEDAVPGEDADAIPVEDAIPGEDATPPCEDAFCGH